MAHNVDVRARALRYLARVRSEAEVRAYLADVVHRIGLTQEEGAATIETLIEEFTRKKYLDDAAYAYDFRARADDEHWGPARFRVELEARGLRPDVVESVVNGWLADRDEKTRVAEAIAALNPRARDTLALARKLLRLGHSDDLVRGALKLHDYAGE